MLSKMALSEEDLLVTEQDSGITPMAQKLRRGVEG